MSLFPCFSESNSNEAQDDNKFAWLTIPKTGAELVIKEESVVLSNEKNKSLVPKVKKRSKRVKKVYEKKIKEKLDKVEKELQELLTDSTFFEDRKGTKQNFLIPTLMKDDVPLYEKPKIRFYKDKSNLRKKMVKWRYFNRISNLKKYDLNIKDQHPQSNEEVITVSDKGTFSKSLSIETQLSQKTASFNQRLSEDPNDEELWIQYIDFQDEIQFFDKYFRESKTGSFAAEEKKLSIINKALASNPSSTVLLHRKFEIMRKIYDLDKVSEELFTAIRQDFGNIMLWKEYIKITQFTLSRCTVSKVLSLFNKAIQKINFTQKGGIIATETNLLQLYVECALFLRQCGLWEQLCMLIRLQLQLNLANSETENYKFFINIPESTIREYEDEVLTCGLPIHALWLRIEKLRQRVHWYPISDTDCEDPQRIIVPSDVSDLIGPITSPSLSLKLAVVTMFLLKVPLIPLQDTVYRILSLDSLSWHLDSAEVLLSAFCSIGITQGRFTSYEESINLYLKDLVSFPQYVNDVIGREEFLNFIQSMFRKISQNLAFTAETVILVWWFRFERSLLIAGKQPKNRKKRLKSLIKDFLKEERHRNNIPLYIEYALLEKEMNQNTDNCVKILETALTLHTMKKSLFLLSVTKNTLTQLYRVYTEILLTMENSKEKCIRLLISLAFLIPEKDVQLNEDSIQRASAEFQKITDDTMNEDYFGEEDFNLEHTQPLFFIEWIYCQAWFLYLTESVWTTVTFLNHIISKISPYKSSSPIFLKTYYAEVITEILITIFHFYCNNNKTGFSILYEYVIKGIQEFPNNMRLLCTLCDLETKLQFASRWYKIEKCLRANDSPLPKLILIMLNQKRLMLCEKANTSAVQCLNQGGPVVSFHGLNNRMKALFIKLTRDNTTQHCPLIWIIYMQYCAQYESEFKYKDIFSIAIENCPWVKSLYMEGAHVLINQVSHIQDILTEKEMRLHITQDEIDILRDS